MGSHNCIETGDHAFELVGGVEPSAVAFNLWYPFIDHARKVGRGSRRRPGRTASGRKRGGGLRGWAKDQGIAGSANGHIPATAVEHSEAAAKGS